MIVFSRVSLSFSTSFKKTDKTYYSFAAKERRKNYSNGSTNETVRFLNEFIFFKEKRVIKICLTLHFHCDIFPRCFLITSEISTIYIYIFIFKYVKHFSFFLSFNLASQMEKRATKRTIEEYLTFDLFSFPFPESASFAAITNVLLVRFDTPLTCETPIFLELSTVVDLFSIYLIVQFLKASKITYSLSR